MAKSSNNRMDKYKHKKSKKKAIITTLIVLLLIAAAAVGCYVYNVKSIVDQSYSGTGLKNETKASKLIRSNKPLSFLVLGTDTGTDGGFGDNRNRVGLTDSMMVVTINPKKETTTLISVPRDIMTSISGFEYKFPQKLNAAYAFKEASDPNASLGEGVGTAIETLEKMFNIPINYYAMVNMSGLSSVVNKIGGISVKSPLTFTFSQETAHETGKDLYKFKKNSSTFKYAADGENFKTYTKMNGDAALAFSRMRYEDPKGDYGRTERQRILLNAIVQKIKKNPTQVINAKFISASTKNIASDLKSGDMLTLGTNYLKATKHIVSYTVQGQGQMYDGVSYQRVTTAQRQAITNKVRAQLGLSKAETGYEFGSDITDSELSQVLSADDLYPENNTSDDEVLKAEKVDY